MSFSLGSSGHGEGRSGQVVVNTGLEGGGVRWKIGCWPWLCMRWVQLQTDRDAMITEFPGSTGRGSCV